MQGNSSLFDRFQVFNTCVALVVLFAALQVTQSHVCAQDSAPTEQSLSESIWYDADQQKAVPIVVRDETKDSVNRGSRWLPKASRLPEPNRSPTSTAAGPLTGTTGMFGTNITLGYVLGWLLMGLIVAALIAGFLYAVMNSSLEMNGSSNGRRKGAGEHMVDEQTLDRVKHLPAELRRTDVNMRDEAERLMNAGRYDQAIILLFGHQLLRLDQAGMLRLNRSKTNGKYYRETRAAYPKTAAKLRQTMDCFERSYFGKHQITRDEFHGLWATNESLEADIAIAEGVAA
jgi:hypothetical protein